MNTAEQLQPTVEVKRCRMCGEFKTLDQYYKQRSGRGGVDTRCIACHPRLAKKEEDGPVTLSYEAVPTMFEQKLRKTPKGIKPKGTEFEPILLVVERCSMTGEWAILTLDRPPLYSANEVIHDARGNHIATAFNRAWEALQERMEDAND